MGNVEFTGGVASGFKKVGRLDRGLTQIADFHLANDYSFAHMSFLPPNIHHEDCQSPRFDTLRELLREFLEEAHLLI